MADEKDDFLTTMMQAPAPEAADESDDKPETEATPAQETGEQAETVAATPTDPPAAATPAATPAAPPQETTVPLAAMMDERKKRQALERQLAEIQQQATPAPSFYQDPERYVGDLVGQVQQTMQYQVYGALEFAAKQQFPDYDEKFSVVEEYAATNPAAVRDVLASPNPALAAYDLGKRLLEYREMQNPEAYRAKVEADIRAKLEAEYAARNQQAAAEAAKASAIPPDLSTSASVSGKTPARTSDVFTQLFPS